MRGGMLVGDESAHHIPLLLGPDSRAVHGAGPACGASRFAFNQCLRMVKTALTHRKTDPGVEVAWTGFDLINAFNAWKKTGDAGRIFTVDSQGNTEVAVTGLAWRTEVYQQVFEEAAVDLGKGLAAWSDSRWGKRKGKRVGFPRFKKKTGDIPSFRLRNKRRKGKPPAIRVGDNDRPVRLSCLASDNYYDTRRLRRLLAKGARHDLLRDRQPPRRSVVGNAERRGCRSAPCSPAPRTTRQ